MKFKLRHHSTRLKPGEQDYSVWVCDLTPEVDNLELYKFFAARFNTVRTAKGNSMQMHGTFELPRSTF